MAYELIQKPAFLNDFALLERPLQKKVVRAVEALQQAPFGATTKKLFSERYKNLYRYRIGDHRIIYAVGTGCISILAVGPRQDVYERFNPSGAPQLGHGLDLASATPQLVPTVPEDPEPSSMPEGGDTSPPGGDAPATTNKASLLGGLLTVWGVPSEAHADVLACTTPEQLLDLDLSADVIDRILHFNSPPTASQVIAQPSLELPSASALDRFAEGTLTGFLLRLDPDQERVARRQLKGPTLVKGGPGTGKSLVAMYRIHHLMRPEQRSLFGHPPRVLFVTFTKALTRATRQLLRLLVGDDAMAAVSVQTLDQLAASAMSGSGQTNRSMTQHQREALVRARGKVWLDGGPLDQGAQAKVLARLTDGYLLDEFDWVIDGRSISDLPEYLSTDRAGRGTRLDERGRKVVWELYRAWREELPAPTFVQAQQLALEQVRGMGADRKYDVVIVDEAQDLKPVGIRLACAHCKSPQGLYLTADEGQTIYGRAYSWSRVAEDLEFRGRTATLRRNYRSTKPIEAAVAQHLAAWALTDVEGRALAVNEGPKPVLAACPGEGAAEIADWLRRSASELGMPTSAAAVLVRSKRTGQALATQLRERGVSAAWIEGRELDLEGSETKVMTMHSAKGLEFPMVCVAGVDAGVVPVEYQTEDSDDRLEFERQEARLFQVAMTRAMRRLLVTYTAASPSPFIQKLDRTLWQCVP